MRLHPVLLTVSGLGAATTQKNFQDGLALNVFSSAGQTDLSAETFNDQGNAEQSHVESFYDDSYGDESREQAVAFHRRQKHQEKQHHKQHRETLPEVYHHRKKHGKKSVSHAQVSDGHSDGHAVENRFLNSVPTVSGGSRGSTHPVVEYDVDPDLVVKHEQDEERAVFTGGMNKGAHTVFLHAKKKKSEQQSNTKTTVHTSKAHSAHSQCLEYAAFLKSNSVSGSKLIQMWMSSCTPAVQADPANSDFKKKCDAVVAAVAPFSDKTDWDEAKLCHGVLQALNGGGA